MDEMEVDSGGNDKRIGSLDVGSVEFVRMVDNVAKAFGLVRHPDPIITLKAIERRIATIKSTGATSLNGSEGVGKEAGHMVPLSSLEIGAQPSNSPKLDDAIRILRLLHGSRLRELQTQINELVVDVQKITANPKCDLSLGKIGR